MGKYEEVRKMKRSFFTVLLLSLAFVLMTGPAHALPTSYSNVSAYFDWSNVKIGTTPGGNNLKTWFETNSTILTSALATNFNPGGNVSTPINGATATYFDANATGTVNASEISSKANAGPTSEMGPNSFASADRALTWQVTADQRIYIDVPYKLEYKLSAAPEVVFDTSWAYGTANLLFGLSRTQAGLPDTATSENVWVSDVLTAGKGPQIAVTDKTGMNSVKLSLRFYQGDTGTINFQTYANANALAPVPIPGALWLLGTGLLGLTGIRRRIKA